MRYQRVSKNFILEEFLPEEMFESKIAHIRFIDLRLINLVQSIRDYTHRPTTINNWHYTPIDNYNFSGFRPPSCDIGSPGSMHRYGMAADIKIDGMEALEVQEMILEKYIDEFKKFGLTRIEVDTPTWTHLDLKPTGMENLHLFPFYKKPKKEIKNA